jgi:hypothetical protein
VLKGKVTSFADDQFTVMIDSGSGRYLSRATVYVGDVARVEFDSVSGDLSSSGGPATRDVSSEQPSSSAVEVKSSVTKDPAPQSSETVLTRESAPVTKEPEPKATEAGTPIKEPETSQPTSTQPEPEAEKSSVRKAGAGVRTANIDVVARRDWTSTGLIVKRGDRIRITATGTVSLDAGGDKTSGPEGAGDLQDSKKLMPEQPTGALIGVIGADNDDFIFIGKSSEFTATRDGLLFLSVNEGTLTDNSGTFRASIEHQPATRRP